jgi:hypothetical protein
MYSMHIIELSQPSGRGAHIIRLQGAKQLCTMHAMRCPHYTVQGCCSLRRVLASVTTQSWHKCIHSAASVRAARDELQTQHLHRLKNTPAHAPCGRSFGCSSAELS